MAAKHNANPFAMVLIAQMVTVICAISACAILATKLIMLQNVALLLVKSLVKMVFASNRMNVPAIQAMCYVWVHWENVILYAPAVAPMDSALDPMNANASQATAISVEFRLRAVFQYVPRSVLMPFALHRNNVLALRVMPIGMVRVFGVSPLVPRIVRMDFAVNRVNVSAMRAMPKLIRMFVR